MNGWEALCVRAAGWLMAGPMATDYVPADEMKAYYGWAFGSGDAKTFCDQCTVFGGIALFARLMAIVTGHATVEADRDRKALLQAYDAGARDAKALLLAEILGPNATERDARELAVHLRAVHDGSDRGGLKALLCRLWGESPAVASDLRGLAQRESQPHYYGQQSLMKPCPNEVHDGCCARLEDL